MGCFRFLASTNHTPPPRVNGRAEPAVTLLKTLRLIIHDIDGGQSDVILMKRHHVIPDFRQIRGMSGFEATFVDQSRTLEFLPRFGVETKTQMFEIGQSARP